MISHSGYRVPDGDPAPYEAPLFVLSAGHYRFVKMKRYYTHRPQGRPDWQLIYIAGGTAQFFIGGVWHTVREGGMVLYYPDEEQEYKYFLDEKPDVYWVHFTGTEVGALLERYALTRGVVHNVGVDARYCERMENIIRELQLKRATADELTTLLLHELLLRMSRGAEESRTDRTRSQMIEQAVSEMEQRFAEPLTVAGLAEQFHVESGWFSRLFRRRMGVSPQQYLTQVRMTKARELLSTTDCSIGEAARLSGYDNQLYFSRLFHKMYGCAPREYRQRQQEGVQDESLFSYLGV